MVSAHLKLSMLSTLYVVLAFVLVSLAATYGLTQKIFGGLFKGKAWGPGVQLNNAGFWVHAVVFALLVFVPMVMSKA